MDTLQSLIVALLVPSCAAYATWKLMPSAARRSLAAAMLRMRHLPRPLEAGLRRAAQAASGCGCDGCDHAQKMSAKKTPAENAPAQQPIRFHPRPRG